MNNKNQYLYTQKKKYTSLVLVNMYNATN